MELRFAPLKSFVDASFFREFSDKKLSELHLSEDQIPICAQYSIPMSNDRFPAISLSLSSFDRQSTITQSVESVPPSFIAPGYLTNVNTLESFKELNKSKLIQSDGKQIIESIINGSALEEPIKLISFHVAAFSDIKKYKFYYWFAFPALQVPFKCNNIRPVATSTSLFKAINQFRDDCLPYMDQWGFFYLEEINHDQWKAYPLKEYKRALNCDKPCFGFVDPCTIKDIPSWPLRNFIALLTFLLAEKDVSILCLRDHLHLDAVPSKSVWIDITLTDANCITADLASKTIGWERNSSGKLAPKLSDLGSLINPIQLASQAVDLNLKLMKWRIAPNIDLDAIKQQKCLLLGAGTLGTNIARGLLGWGVKKITFVDNGKVSFSNPVRQPLYKFDDCLNEGASKAKKAAEAMKEIYPLVDCSGYELEIPMAGHPITNELRQHSDYDELVKLITDHDVIFLLMDSRESRWLPTTMCSAMQKLVINVAVGFDSYVVMRHGISEPFSEQHRPHLGCYFCNDVVAPIDSVSGQTLDQMCTVTRPGVAMLASANAVELLASVLQHPLRGNAPAFKESDDFSRDTPLSILPHQIRGFLHNFDALKIWGPSYPNCSACSAFIVDAWRSGGWKFVKEALSNPNLVAEISGLAEIQRKAEELDLASGSDWGTGGEGATDGELEILE